MKIEIIPTILVKTFEEVKERIKAAEDYVNWMQLDIMDGIFVDNKTWNQPQDLKNFQSKIKLEAHLMVKEPEKVIDDWLEVVERIIIHFEAKISDIKKLIGKVHNKGKEIGLAINPETPIEVVKPFLEDLDLILCMSVPPGRGGQEFREEILSKIKLLREIWPNGKIEVDGGVTDKNIKKVIEAGADLICAGTHIFKSKDIKQAIENLRK